FVVGRRARLPVRHRFRSSPPNESDLTRSSTRSGPAQPCVGWKRQRSSELALRRLAHLAFEQDTERGPHDGVSIPFIAPAQPAVSGETELELIAGLDASTEQVVMPNVRVAAEL